MYPSSFGADDGYTNTPSGPYLKNTKGNGMSPLASFTVEEGTPRKGFKISQCDLEDGHEPKFLTIPWGRNVCLLASAFAALALIVVAIGMGIGMSRPTSGTSRSKR